MLQINHCKPTKVTVFCIFFRRSSPDLALDSGSIRLLDQLTCPLNCPGTEPRLFCPSTKPFTQLHIKPPNKPLVESFWVIFCGNFFCAILDRRACPTWNEKRNTLISTNYQHRQANFFVGGRQCLANRHGKVVPLYEQVLDHFEFLPTLLDAVLVFAELGASSYYFLRTRGRGQWKLWEDV